jgi:hypothetical protein
MPKNWIVIALAVLVGFMVIFLLGNSALGQAQCFTECDGQGNCVTTCYEF